MLIFSCPLLATRGGLEIARERWVNRLSDLNVILWIRKRKGSRLGGRWLVVRLQWRHLHLIGDSVVSPSRFSWDHVVAATQTQRWSPVDRPIFQECSNATGKAAGNDASTFLFFSTTKSERKKLHHSILFLSTPDVFRLICDSSSRRRADGNTETARGKPGNKN